MKFVWLFGQDEYMADRTTEQNLSYENNDFLKILFKNLEVEPKLAKLYEYDFILHYSMHKCIEQSI